jgi:hypothetical protein
VLDLLYTMNAFTVKEQISPLEYAKLQKKQRKQASSKKSNSQQKNDIGW